MNKEQINGEGIFEMELVEVGEISDTDSVGGMDIAMFQRAINQQLDILNNLEGTVINYLAEEDSGLRKREKIKAPPVQ